MTIKEKIAELKQAMAQIEKSKALQIAVLAVNERRQKRIFFEGKNTDGGKIGSYSTKPMLATKDQFVVKSKFKVTKEKVGGKTKDKWIKFPKASKAVPVMVLENGYKQFRELNGRENSFVNLRLRGEEQNDLSSGIKKIDNFKYEVAFKKDINAKKKEGQEKKYGSIFKHTKSEIASFNNTIRIEMAKIRL